MPLRLFETVVRPPSRPRRPGAVPLSIALHASVLAAAILAPVALPPPEPPPLGRPIVDLTSRRPSPPRRNADAPPARPTVRPRSVLPVVMAAGPPPVISDAAAPSIDDDGPAPCLVNCDHASSEGAGDGPPGGEPNGIDGQGPPGPGGDGTPLRPGGKITPPERIHYVAPTYPDLARTAGVGGTVVLDCTLDTDGRVTDVRVLSGHPLLNAAAVNAVRQWIYTPTRLNGQAVRVLLTVTVRFVPRR